MKIELLMVGKTSKKFLISGIEEYFKRINRYNSFEMIVIPDIRKGKSMENAQVKKMEGEQILRKLNGNPFIILLDENGKTFSSTEFAHFLQESFFKSFSKIAFVVGGAYGFSDEIYSRCHLKISLSEMTFSHQLVRLVFLEQLYRAFTIIKGEPYHHE